MKNYRIVFCSKLAATLLFAAVSLYSQTTRPNFTRAQTFDAQHYVIRASFDREKGKVFGDTTVVLKPLMAGFRVAELDAVDMTFDSVKLDPSGTDLQYKAAAGKVTVTLDKAYGPDDTISIRFKYTATPTKGVYFVPAESDRAAQIWSQGEPDEARHWFPSFDFPSDKATTEEYITAEKGLTVIGNGEFLGKEESSAGMETWHYKMPVPHSTYLVSFVIGDYTRVADTYKNVPLGFYVYKGREATAHKAFDDTKSMIGTYEQLTGVDFPYNKYDQTIVAAFKFGGMENITATTMADTEIFFGEMLGGNGIVTDLVSHELAHSWFGDMVTCRNWAELWLNEGFATYMEAAYREQKFGREDYIRKITSNAEEFMADDAISSKRHGLFNQRAGFVDELFDNSAITYSKGGAVIHTLREQVGTEAFWKAINLYLNRHKFGSVESTDLRAAMEETSGQDLGWFFDQWVYGAGTPRLDVRQTYSARTKTLKLTITQTQKADAITPAVFRLPMDLDIKTAGGQSNEKLDITKRVQVLSFKVAGKPIGLTFDKGTRIPIKRVKVRPLVTIP